MSTTAPIPAIVPDAPLPQPVQSVAPVQSAQGPATDSGASQSASAPQAPSAAQVVATPIDDQPDLRLVIEEDKAAGSYVYMTVDPRSGKVISQIPREELLRMREASGYKPGSVVNARS